MAKVTTRKKTSAARRKSSQTLGSQLWAAAQRSHLLLLSISVGVLFFIIPLALLVAAPISGYRLGELTGALITLWLLGGAAFAIGAVEAVRESRWSVLFLSGPAVAFGLFCIIATLSNIGISLLNNALAI